MFRNPLVDAAVVLIVVLLIFGPKRLPMLGRSLGQGMREFKDSITGNSSADEEGDRPELTESTAMPQAGSPATPQTTSAPAAERNPEPTPEGAPGPGPGRESAEVGPRENRS